jgi:hypothetical protein
MQQPKTLLIGKKAENTMTELKNLVVLAVANTMITSLVMTSSTVNDAGGEVVNAGMN